MNNKKRLYEECICVTECPCKECICVPVCRYKSYLKMMSQCSIIKDYIPDYSVVSEKNAYKLRAIEGAINPNTWRIAKEPKASQQIFFNRYSTWGKVIK